MKSMREAPAVPNADAIAEKMACAQALVASMGILPYRDAQARLRTYAYAERPGDEVHGEPGRTLYLFAGPNGSGKSTLLAQYIPACVPAGVEYVCPDIYASGIYASIEDEYERYTRAIALAGERRARLLAAGRSFVMETVLSRADKLDLVADARHAGYRVVAVFVCTASADINCERVRQRVTQGGHNVPEDKLRARYARSLDNLPLLAPHTDELYVYDNSGERHTLALAMLDGKKVYTPHAPSWVKARL